MTDIQDLWRAHVLRYFRQFRDNVEEDIEALADFGPAEQSFLTEQAALLASFMAEQKERIDDPQLLQLACFAPGRLRGIDPPLLVLSPERGGFSTLRLQQAANKAKRLSECIEAWRLLAPGALDGSKEHAAVPDAIIALASISQAREIEIPELMPLYAGLNLSDASALADRAVTLLAQSDVPGAEDVAREVLTYLASLVDGALDHKHRHLAESGFFYPGVVFRGAGPEARNTLVERLPRESDTARNWIMQCLAWIGDAEVRRLFASWTARPPAWARHMAPAVEFAMEAGWELTKKGERRELAQSTGIRLVPADPGNEAGILGTLSTRDEACPQCGDMMVSMIDLDLSDPLFDFLNYSGNRLSVPGCMRCAAYHGGLFAEVDLKGNGGWSHYNREPKYLDRESEWEPFLPDRLVPGPALLTSVEGCRDFEGSRIGGHPVWVQYPEYPVCPECRSRMPFLAQIDLGDIDDYGEGIYYVFHCRECDIAATGFQQT